jgi:hypothetical protein
VDTYARRKLVTRGIVALSAARQEALTF